MSKSNPTVAIPCEFLPIHRSSMPSHDEWIAVLPDSTKIVIADLNGKPDPTGIEKAVAIVQSRDYLEKRARQLLVVLGKECGEWRLLAIDFGIEAQYDEFEFLMCFVFQNANSELTDPSAYVEVGFAVSTTESFSPVFILSFRTIADSTDETVSSAGGVRARKRSTFTKSSIYRYDAGRRQSHTR